MKTRRSSSGEIHWSSWLFLALVALFFYELLKQISAAKTTGDNLATSVIKAVDAALADITSAIESPFKILGGGITSATSGIGSIFSWLFSIPLAILNGIFSFLSPLGFASGAFSFGQGLINGATSVFNPNTGSVPTITGNQLASTPNPSPTPGNNGGFTLGFAPTLQDNVVGSNFFTQGEGGAIPNSGNEFSFGLNQ